MMLTRPSNIAYLRIRKNEFTLRDIKTGKELKRSPSAPFTTARLLVGEFCIASELLKQMMKEIYPRSFWMPAPGLVVHPLEMTEGGLSEVESRLLKELAIGCGAADAVVITGPGLTDQQVKEKFEQK